MKPKTKADPASEQVNEKTMVKVYGPYDNPKWGRSVMVIAPTGKAYIGQKNCLHNLDDYEIKEIKGDEEELGTIAEDLSKIQWKSLEDKKSVGGASMIETNTILKDILELAQSCQKALTGLNLIARRWEKTVEKKSD